MIYCRRHDNHPNRNVSCLYSPMLICRRTAHRPNANGFWPARAAHWCPSCAWINPPEELLTFSDLVQESTQFGQEWSIVFAAALSGGGGLAPTSEAAQKPLERVVDSIKAGTFVTFVPFDRQGLPVLPG